MLFRTKAPEGILTFPSVSTFACRRGVGCSLDPSKKCLTWMELLYNSADSSEFGSSISSLEPDQEDEEEVSKDEKVDLRDELAHTASTEAVFSCVGPSSTERFSFSRFLKRFIVFLFPFLSLPGFIFSPFELDSAEIEREFIVSGASLQRSFDYPTVSLYFTSISLLLQICCINFFVWEPKKRPDSDLGKLSMLELVSPLIGWVINACTCAFYFCFRRTPHSLERMNRELTAELTALAASAVDAKCSICIYTWDEAGRDKVKNRQYRKKWVIISFFIALCQGMALPADHWIFRKESIGNTTTVPIALASASLACFVFTATYYGVKCLDMQREVLSKLSVLTKIAFIERKSLFHPGKFYREHFCCDSKLDISDLKSGFPGWYTTRSLVLCASPGANHYSRGYCFSVLITTVILFTTLVSSYYFQETFYVTERLFIGFVTFTFTVSFTWGPLCIYYVTVSTFICSELKRHMYIMDVTSLYHRLRHHDVEGALVIKQCREIAETHDCRPCFFNLPLNPFLSGLIMVWIAAGMIVSAYSFISFVLSSRSDLQNLF